MAPWKDFEDNMNERMHMENNLEYTGNYIHNPEHKVLAMDRAVASWQASHIQGSDALGVVEPTSNHLTNIQKYSDQGIKL